MQAAGTTRIVTKRSYGIGTGSYLLMLPLMARTSRKELEGAYQCFRPWYISSRSRGG